jgi:YVTN family beta-propeller protein
MTRTNGRRRWAWSVVLVVIAASGAARTDEMPAPSTTAISGISADAVFVVNGGDNTLSVVDPGASVVVGTIGIANAMFPHHIYLSPDRSQLLVAIPGMDLSMGHDVSGSAQGAVLLLDAQTGTTLASVRLDMMNHNATFSPDGSEVWTSQMAMPGSVLILDPATLATKQTIAVGDMPAEVTFTPDASYAFVANGMSNDVTVIDPVTKAIVATIPVDKGPVGAWPAPDGRMYVDCEEGQTVSVIDPATLTVSATYPLGFMPGMVGMPPSGGEVWVTDSDSGQLVFFDPATGARTGQLPTGAGAHGIAFSSDGCTAYVTNQAAGTLSVVDVASHTVRGSISVGNKPNGLVYR